MATKGTRTIQELRHHAQAVKRFRALMIQQGRMLDLGDVPTGYLGVFCLGNAILHHAKIDHEEDAMANGLTAETLVHWHALGAPTFHLTTDAVESFLLTDVSNLTWGDLVFPYPAMLVRVPAASPLRFIDEFQVDRQVQDVWVSRTMLPRLHPSQWKSVMDRVVSAMARGASLQEIRDLEREWDYGPHLVVTAEGTESHGLVRTFTLDNPTQSLLDLVDPGPNSIAGRADWKNEKSKYTMSLVCRVLANLCIWLDGSDTQTGKPNWRRPPPPKPTQGWVRGETFVVGRDIHLPEALKNAARTMAQAERDQEARKAWHLMDRLLVRGHWRSQAYGPKLASHRRIQIAPYWKGDPNGAIVTREFTLGKPDPK